MAISAARGCSVRHNLPATLTSFIGRQRELADLQARMADARLLTLTGVGGCGKTRLALEFARLVLDRYPDGVWLVELAPLVNAALVPHAVAAVFGVRATAGQSTLSALIARLCQRRLLLVLDNCEHLLDACARLADAILRACPDARVLTTSRQPLGITGEVAWRVPSLPVPDPQRRLSLSELQCNPAVRLFTERALAVEPHFSLTEQNAAAVVQVCARLDGIPLALELAAARMASLSVDQLVGRLDQRFHLLTGGSRAALHRQQTLRATLDWSYDLLAESERRLLNRLAVFAGGWSLEAAEAVCGTDDIGQADVLELLGQLVSKSLVIAEQGAGGGERYRLLETVRQYAHERLVAAGEAEMMHRRHADYFLVFAETRNSPDELKDTAPPRTALELRPSRPMLELMECEQDNLRAALRWRIDSGDPQQALSQAAALFPIWFIQGSLTEGRAWLDELLALSKVKDAPEVQARALPMLASLARRHGEYTVALDAFNALLAAQQAAGGGHEAAVTLGQLANVHYLRTDYPAAWTCLEASRAEAGDHPLPLLVEFWQFLGGQVALHEGRYDLARTLLLQANETVSQRRPILMLGYVLINLGIVAREQGHPTESHDLLEEALRVAVEYDDRTLLAHVLEGFSGLASALEQHERAMCLSGAAAALRDAIGAPLPPAWRIMNDRWLPISRRALSDEAATAAWQVGQDMSLVQAVEFARSASSQRRSSPPVSGEPASPLTRREQEVAALVAQGLSNRQIAERLVITPRTVAAHIENILGKLGFTSRTQVGVWASEHDRGRAHPV
jgi:non-specific serine/threonine protein kinase